MVERITPQQAKKVVSDHYPRNPEVSAAFAASALPMINLVDQLQQTNIYEFCDLLGRPRADIQTREIFWKLVDAKVLSFDIYPGEKNAVIRFADK